MSINTLHKGDDDDDNNNNNKSGGNEGDDDGDDYDKREFAFIAPRRLRCKS
jgi:hypothetical protein